MWTYTEPPGQIAPASALNGGGPKRSPRPDEGLGGFFNSVFHAWDFNKRNQQPHLPEEEASQRSQA
eukprot:scaffold318975_cov42-Prasinocladus_malaysianus.AAC.3